MMARGAKGWGGTALLMAAVAVCLYVGISLPRSRVQRTALFYGEQPVAPMMVEEELMRPTILVRNFARQPIMTASAASPASPSPAGKASTTNSPAQTPSPKPVSKGVFPPGVGGDQEKQAGSEKNEVTVGNIREGRAYQRSQSKTKDEGVFPPGLDHDDKEGSKDKSADQGKDSTQTSGPVLPPSQKLLQACGARACVAGRGCDNTKFFGCVRVRLSQLRRQVWLRKRALRGAMPKMLASSEGILGTLPVIDESNGGPLADLPDAPMNPMATLPAESYPTTGMLGSYPVVETGEGPLGNYPVVQANGGPLSTLPQDNSAETCGAVACNEDGCADEAFYACMHQLYARRYGTVPTVLV